MLIESVDESKLQELKDFETEMIRQFFPELIEKIVRIAVNKTGEAVNMEKFRILSVGAVTDDMPMPPVVVVFQGEKDPALHIKIEEIQLGDGENNFAENEIEYLLQIAFQTEIEYEIPVEIVA
jgi:hypothetical protein